MKKRAAPAFFQSWHRSQRVCHAELEAHHGGSCSELPGETGHVDTTTPVTAIHHRLVKSESDVELDVVTVFYKTAEFHRDGRRGEAARLRTKY